jgi:hypothetical protein
MWTLSKCCHGKRGDRTAIGSSRDELARGERRMSDGGDAEARRAFAVPVARGSFEGWSRPSSTPRTKASAPF